MKRNLYLNVNGRLHRKESTIFYYTKEGRKIVPVEQVKAIFAVGHISVTSGVVSYFSKLGIPIHFFGHYGHYEGSFLPRRRLISGYSIVNQSRAYLNREERITIATAFVKACINNMQSVLKDYSKRVQSVSTHLNVLSELESETTPVSQISVLMSIEGRAWAEYYGAFNDIIKDFDMGTRVKRPPNNPVNALISFGNSLLYSTTITQLYHTQLDPSISYLHEPSARRFSLSLDIAEVFKPGLVDLLIFKLLNLGTIQEAHFDQELNRCLLTQEGRRIFVTEFDSVLRSTNKHPKLKRQVSNEYLIRLDAYKLLKTVCERKVFRPYLITRGM